MLRDFKKGDADASASSVSRASTRALSELTNLEEFRFVQLSLPFKKLLSISFCAFL